MSFTISVFCSHPFIDFVNTSAYSKITINLVFCDLICTMSPIDCDGNNTTGWGRMKSIVSKIHCRGSIAGRRVGQGPLCVETTQFSVPCHGQMSNGGLLRRPFLKRGKCSGNTEGLL